MDHNFYNSYSIEGSRIEVEGRICRTISFEIEENWGSTSFDNEEGVFFKCEKNGQKFINHVEKEHNMWTYVEYILGLRFIDIQETNAINSYVMEKIEKKDH